MNYSLTLTVDDSIIVWSHNNDFPETSFHLILQNTYHSHLLLDHGMNFAVSNVFSASPLSTTILQNYLFLSQNIEHLKHDLTDINWKDNPFSIFFVIAPLFGTLSPPYCLIFNNNNDKFHPTTHCWLFTPHFFIPLPNTMIQFNQLSFKNKAIAITHALILYC